MTITATADAVDRKTGMTLDELTAFVQDAQRLNLPGGTPVTVVTGWRAQVQSISAAADPDLR